MTARRSGKYLNGDTYPRGAQTRPRPDPFEPFVDYVTARLIDDPHLWARTLCDELEDLGYAMSYQSADPPDPRHASCGRSCQACRTATERPNAVIEHPPGEETQWDWLDLPNPPGVVGMGVDGAPVRRHPWPIRASGAAVLAPRRTNPASSTASTGSPAAWAG